MTHRLTVKAQDGQEHPLYQATVSLEGVTDDSAPVEAIRYAITRLKEAGYPDIQRVVVTWTVRQHWVDGHD